MICENVHSVTYTSNNNLTQNNKLSNCSSDLSSIEIASFGVEVLVDFPTCLSTICCFSRFCIFRLGTGGWLRTLIVTPFIVLAHPSL